jgi:tetrahydromethanopterin S-methyltransferase subunit C
MAAETLFVVAQLAAQGRSVLSEGANMSTNAHVEFIGMMVQISGVVSAVAGVVLSLHHWPAAAALIGGGVAYVIGKKLRAE